VAVDTGRRRRRGVVMMRRRIEARGLVAARAQRVALGAQPSGVRLVGGAAAQAPGGFSRLHERAPLVGEVRDLTVVVVELALEQRGAVVVEEGIARARLLGDRRALRMASGAG